MHDTQTATYSLAFGYFVIDSQIKKFSHTVQLNVLPSQIVIHYLSKIDKVKCTMTIHCLLQSAKNLVSICFSRQTQEEYYARMMPGLLFVQVKLELVCFVE